MAASTTRPAASRPQPASPAASASTPIAPSTACRTRRLGKLIVATEEAEIPGVAEDRGGVPRQRRHQSRMADRLGGPASRTRAELRRGAVVALDRHHRQPRADARLSGRGRGSRRVCRVPLAGAGRTGPGGRVQDGFELDVGGDEPVDDPLPYPGQRRRPPCAGPGARDRRRAAGDDPAGLFLPRRLFHPARARPRSAG